MLRRLFLLALAVALVAGACTQGDDAASEETTSDVSTVTTLTVASTTTAAPTTTSVPEPSTEETAPFHDISDDPVVVSGEATCDLSMPGMDPDGWLATCELDMSDPKVAGTETQSRIRMFEAGEAGDVWVAEEAVITNDEGLWRGTAQAADDGRPSGEAHYFGEGAYDGLEFHYYFGQFPEEFDDERTVYRGWISGGD